MQRRVIAVKSSESSYLALSCSGLAWGRTLWSREWITGRLNGRFNLGRVEDFRNANPNNLLYFWNIEAASSIYFVIVNYKRDWIFLFCCTSVLILRGQTRLAFEWFLPRWMQSQLNQLYRGGSCFLQTSAESAFHFCSDHHCTTTTTPAANTSSQQNLGWNDIELWLYENIFWVTV